MTEVKKSIKVRLYPTKEQEILIDKTIGCVRFVYNQTLADCKQSYEQSKHFPSRNERIKNLVPLKEKYEFLKEVDSQTLQQSVRDFNRALDNFFRNRSHFGFPKFRARRADKQSYRTTYNSCNAKVLDARHIKLPKLGRIKTTHFDMPRSYKSLKI